jgi:hypothetical protein
MTMNQESKPNSRRTFLKNLALMSGAGTLLAGAARTVGVGPRENPMGNPDGRRSQGYRLTPHIRKYYKKAAS